MLEGKYNFKEQEPKWEEFWQKEGVYKFDFNDKERKIFSIDTPPPTVSGNIHIGHINSYSQGDIIARYKRMRGFNVFYPFGFDNNGLPTERLVEKNRGIRAHELPRMEFIDICLDVVKEYNEEFKKLFIRAGNSADWDLSYSTIDERCQKTSQKSFIELAKQGIAYRANKTTPWCTECRTSVSQMELDSKDLPSVFNYLNFDLADGTGKVQIATTRPEFLPACVAVFVHPSDEKNKHLIGKKVLVPLFGFEVEILAEETVEMEKGTGAVMCCTFGDQADEMWVRKHKLPIKLAIDDGGRMTALCGKYEGLKTKQARQAIIDDLKEAGYIYKQEEIVHAVAVHERCSTPIEFMPKPQWFIKYLDKKEKLIELGNQIDWHPESMKTRYLTWVENLNQDWAISRQRYFGIPFPVWYCKECGEVIFADEKDLPVNPMTSKPKHACPKCGSMDFEPETDVLDTWATSSCTPQINCRWIDDKELYDRMMPMDVRPNAHEIIRTWDLYTITKSLYHSNCLPWRNLMISGFVLASKGEKISKSKGNAKETPEGLIGEYGADITRYWAANGGLGRDVFFSYDEFKNGARLTNKLWNASKFVLMFLEGYTPKKPAKLLAMDKYIMATFNSLVKSATKHLDNYEIGFALEEIEKFFWNFCDNYIELVKNRLYKPEVYGEAEKESAQYACYNVLLGLLKFFAIYMPHITEEIYQAYFASFEGVKSIHNSLIREIEVECDDKIIKAGDEVIEILSQVRGYKSQNNMSLKDEIETITIKTPSKAEVEAMLIDLKPAGGLKEIILEDEGELSVEINK